MRKFLLFCAIAFIGEAGTARDVYVVGGFADGAPIRYGIWTRWDSDVLFYNSSSATQTVRLINVSNGSDVDLVGDSFDVPPMAAVSLPHRFRPSGWVSPLWVWKFEAPLTVETTSFFELYEKIGHLPEPGASRGQIRLPVFERLAPPGEEQVFLGTDLGLRDRRVNVAIYNAADVTAIAEVVVRRNCDGLPLVTETFAIPPDTVIQHGAVHSGVVGYTSCAENSTRGTYVTVTVDQPSLAWVSALANDEATSVTLNVIP